MDWRGVALFAFCAALVLTFLRLGRIPSRWPHRDISRDGNPDFFWFHIVIYGLGAIIGVVLTLHSVLSVLLGISN